MATRAVYSLTFISVYFVSFFFFHHVAECQCIHHTEPLKLPFLYGCILTSRVIEHDCNRAPVTL